MSAATSNMPPHASQIQPEAAWCLSLWGRSRNTRKREALRVAYSGTDNSYLFFRNQAEARMAIFDFIEAWYNPHRRHSSLGQMSPLNYERSHATAA